MQKVSRDLVNEGIDIKLEQGFQSDAKVEVVEMAVWDRQLIDN
jgi:hypothetical protein